VTSATAARRRVRLLRRVRLDDDWRPRLVGRTRSWGVGAGEEVVTEPSALVEDAAPVPVRGHDAGAVRRLQVCVDAGRGQVEPAFSYDGATGRVTQSQVNLQTSATSALDVTDYRYNQAGYFRWGRSSAQSWRAPGA
jgi:hypothetical protein